MSYRFKSCFNIRILQSLHKKTFPTDDMLEFKNNINWVLCDDDNIVGFTSLKVFDETICFLSRTGILPKARKQGFHKKAIKLREKFARRHNFKYVVTYVSTDNSPSFVNLITSGYDIYTPEWKWVGSEFIYLRKKL